MLFSETDGEGKYGNKKIEEKKKNSGSNFMKLILWHFYYKIIAVILMI